MIESPNKIQLLEEARQRLERSVLMRRCRERMPDADDELTACIEEVDGYLRQLLNIQRVCLPVDYQVEHDDLVLDAGWRAPLSALQHDITAAEACYIYGCTLGFDSSEALAALNHDYILHQFQHFVSREILFIIGRNIHKSILYQYPDKTLKRCAILLSNSREDDKPCIAEDEDAAPVYWSPQDVSNLLQMMPAMHMVKVLDSGCMSPIYTLLGLMFVYPQQEGDHV